MKVKDISDTTIKENDLVKVDICKGMIFIVKKDPTNTCHDCCFNGMNMTDRNSPLYHVCCTRVIHCQGNRLGPDAYIFKVFSGV